MKKIFNEKTNWKVLAEMDEGFPGFIGVPRMSEENKNTDLLKSIFDAQEKFRRIMGKGKDCIVDLMDEKQKGQLVYDHIQAISSELQELMDCIYWKSWAKEAKEGKRYMFRNMENAKEEIADIYCFLGDICAAVGMGPEELAAINIRKTEVNINRQLTKYAMDTKDGKDSATIWEQIKNGELTGKSPAQAKSDAALENIAKTQMVNKEIQELVKQVNNHGGLPHNQDEKVISLAPKYMSEQAEQVFISQIPTELHAYSVTLLRTNETKRVSIYGEVMTGGNPRIALMQKISIEFNLTKPFEIVE